MEIQLKVSKFAIVTAEGRTHTEVFEQLAELQEVFGQTECGKCGNQDLRFVVRENKDKDKFYELRCTNPKCRAVLAFGQHKQGGTLFPKRKGEVGEDGKSTYLPNNGWQTYNPQTKEKE